MTPKAKLAFFLILMLTAAAGPFSMQVFLPALPAIQTWFSVDQSTAQLTLSLSMVSIAISTLFYGPVSDRFGRRPVMIAGMALFLGGSLLSTVAPSIGLLIVGRIIQAAGSSSGMVLGRAMVRDAYGAKDAPKVINYLTMAMVTAPMIAPVIGGFLTDGFGWRSNFAVTAMVAAITAVLVITMLQETLPPDARTVAGAGTGSASRAAGSLKTVAQSRRFWGYSLISSLQMAVFFAFISGAPYLMSHVLNRPPSEYGIWFLGVPGLYVAGSFVATRILPVLGLDRSIVWGSLLCALVLPVAAWLYLSLPLTPMLLFVPTYVIAFFQGLVIANGMAGALNAAPHAIGAASGLAGFVQMMISAASAQASGIFVRESIWPLMIVMSACSALAILLLPLIRNGAASDTPAGTLSADRTWNPDSFLPSQPARENRDAYGKTTGRRGGAEKRN